MLLKKQVSIFLTPAAQGLALPVLVRSLLVLLISLISLSWTMTRFKLDMC
jgi:hypothetical protein